MNTHHKAVIESVWRRIKRPSRKTIKAITRKRASKHNEQNIRAFMAITSILMGRDG